MRRKALNHKLLTSLWSGGEYAFFWRNRRSLWFPVNKIPDITKPMHNTYFGVHPTSVIPPKNSKNENSPPQFVRSQTRYIAVVNALYADYDAKDFGGKMLNVEKHFLSLSQSPDVAIYTGGGYHCYWWIKQLVLSTPEMTRVTQDLQAEWVQRVGADTGAKDLTRILRLPGTYNLKYKPPADVLYLKFIDRDGNDALK